MTCGGEHIWNRQHNLSRRLQNMKSLPLSVSLIVNIIVTCSKSRDKSHGHNSVLCRNCGQGWICCQKFGRKIGFWEENSGKTRNMSSWQNYDKMPIFPLIFLLYIHPGWWRELADPELLQVSPLSPHFLERRNTSMFGSSLVIPVERLRNPAGYEFSVITFSKGSGSESGWVSLD